MEEGKEALQEILRLYNFTGVRLFGEADRGHRSIRQRTPFRARGSENGIAFARGTRVEMELDEEQFVGVGVYCSPA